ncbi:hypothetical protein M0804_001073 [Polistes exclamans]|nr:hypothetical protein M0804_001073 [Polistes exclamans]
MVNLYNSESRPCFLSSLPTNSSKGGYQELGDDRIELRSWITKLNSSSFVLSSLRWSFGIPFGGLSGQLWRMANGALRYITQRPQIPSGSKHTACTGEDSNEN